MTKIIGDRLEVTLIEDKNEGDSSKISCLFRKRLIGATVMKKPVIGTSRERWNLRKARDS